MDDCYQGMKALHGLLAGILCLQLQDTLPKAFQSYSVFEREFRFWDYIFGEKYCCLDFEENTRI